MITIIVACTDSRLIGVDGKLPWHDKKDLQHFKNTTMGYAIIMGRGTYDSIGRRHLPGRLNVVISGKGIQNPAPGLVVANSHEQALTICKALGYKEIFIIGGESVYRKAITYANQILMTVVPEPVGLTGEVFNFFPSIGLGWHLAAHRQENGLTVLTYKRK